jgi:transcriptional regulator with XRE-family HTH domain
MSRSLTGTRIREQRRSKKLRQIDLARDVGISPSYLNLIEHNKRSIAGRTLNALAERLELEPEDLSQGPDSDLLESLQMAANSFSHSQAELERLEEFAGRFPGWADLLKSLFSQFKDQRESLEALSDRLNHDPFLQEATHLMLSNVTAIRSTASILATNSEISAAQSKKFIANLHSESKRLSNVAAELVAYFDKSTEVDKGENNQETPLQIYLAANQFHLPRLETGKTTADIEISELAPFKNNLEEREIQLFFQRYSLAVAALPHEKFLQAAKECTFDPVQLSRKFVVPLDLVFFRLAHMPPDGEAPIFGIIECDASGGVLYRRELKELSLPKYSSACPLWPLYRAFSQPLQPIMAFITTPVNERLITYSFSTNQGEAGFGLPGVLRSSMIFSADRATFPDTKHSLNLPNVEVGSHCSICPRESCSSRRANHILQ